MTAISDLVVAVTDGSYSVAHWYRRELLAEGEGRCLSEVLPRTPRAGGGKPTRGRGAQVSIALHSVTMGAR